MSSKFRASPVFGATYPVIGIVSLAYPLMFLLMLLGFQSVHISVVTALWRSTPSRMVDLAASAANAMRSKYLPFRINLAKLVPNAHDRWRSLIVAPLRALRHHAMAMSLPITMPKQIVCRLFMAERMTLGAIRSGQWPWPWILPSDTSSTMMALAAQSRIVTRAPRPGIRQLDAEQPWSSGRITEP